MTTVGLVAAARTISGLTAGRCLKFTGHAGMPMHQIGRSRQTALALSSALKSFTCPRSDAFSQGGKLPLVIPLHKWRIAHPQESLLHPVVDRR